MTTPGGGGTGNLGGINFLIKVGTAAFKKGLNGAEQTAKKTTGKIGGFFSKMQGRFQGAAGKIPFVGSALAALATPAGLATAAIGALVGGLAASIKSFVSTGDEIQKMATRTGFSTEALSEMRHALQISGSDIKGFENGIRRMSGFIEDSKDGLATSTDALDKLGISVEDLQGLSPEESFRVLSSAIADLPGEVQKAALAQDVFGRSGTRLLPLLKEGSAGIAALRQEAHELGVVFDQDAANSAAEFSDSMTRLKGRFQGIAFTVAKNLVPTLTKIIDWATEIIPKIKAELMPLWLTLKDSLGGVFATVKNDLLPALKDLWVAIGPVLIPVAKTIAVMFGQRLKGIFEVFAGIIKTVAGVLTGDFGGAWEGIRTIALGVMRQIASVYNATIAKFPGVATIDMQKVADAIGIVETKVEETKEVVKPALEEIEGSMESLAETSEETSERVVDSYDQIARELDRLDQRRTRAAEALVAAMDAEAEAAEDLAAAIRAAYVDDYFESVRLHLEKAESLRKASKEKHEAIAAAAEQMAAATREAYVDDYDEAVRLWLDRANSLVQASGETANALVEDAKRTADETLAAHDRMTNSWDRFKVNQDEVVAAMNENSISFEDVIKGLASDFGISTVEMANKAIGMGVTYGDTMALMEAFGRDRVDGIVGDIIRLLKTTDVAQSALTQISLAAGQAHNRAVAAREGAYSAAANQFNSFSGEAKRAYIAHLGGQGGDFIENFAAERGTPLPSVPTLGNGNGVHVTVELDGDVFSEAVATANTGNGRRGVD